MRCREVSTTDLILKALRAEARRAGFTYATIAGRLGTSESTVKRLFAGGDPSLGRLTALCAVLGITLQDLLRKALEDSASIETLTLEQERALAADPRLLLVATCCLDHWTPARIVGTYDLDEPECILKLAQLDRLGFLHLQPMNRYQLRVSPVFRWRTDGPVQAFFREHVLPECFAASFEGPADAMVTRHLRLSADAALELRSQVERLAREAALLHDRDRRTRQSARDSYTMVIGLRAHEPRAFQGIRRRTA